MGGWEGWGKGQIEMIGFGFGFIFFLFSENKGFVISLRLLSWRREEGKLQWGKGTKWYGRDQPALPITFSRGLVKGAGHRLSEKRHVCLCLSSAITASLSPDVGLAATGKP